MIEFRPRYGTTIGIIYFNDEVRGQVEIRDDAEKELWSKAVALVRDESEKSILE